MATAPDVSEGTVFRIKRRFAEGGLEETLKDRPQAHRYRKMDDRAEAGGLRVLEAGHPQLVPDL